MTTLNKPKRTVKTPVKKFYISIHFYVDDGLRSKIVKKKTMRFSNLENAKKRWDDLYTLNTFSNLYTGIQATTNLPVMQQMKIIKNAWYF